MQRRTLITAIGAGAAAAGASVFLSACEAKKRGDPMRVLSAEEQRTLEALAEVLLPGAREAGVAHFVDTQLARPAAESLLTLRYFDWPPPYASFYQACLGLLNAASMARHNNPYADLAPADAEAMVGLMATGKLEPWPGPPAQLFYITVRSDAVDVVYGTQAGFEKLGVPYMAHIEPPSPW